MGDYGVAARWLREADALVITAGAGMGVDSGLPDFRGNEGFWNAYPPYRHLGVGFIDMANPGHFHEDPAFAWGFYGHRTHLYRDTVPHAGFAILQRWREQFGLDTFVVTSNVDGQFQKAGFTPGQIQEVHGSIHHLQCLQPCSGKIWPNREDIPVDPSTMRARKLPRCPDCGGIARPNILMFGDGGWLGARSDAQAARLRAFLSAHRDDHVLVIEVGAGTAVPTIRNLGEHLGGRRNCRLIRVNPREPELAGAGLSLPVGALEGLQRIDAAAAAG